MSKSDVQVCWQKKNHQGSSPDGLFEFGRGPPFIGTAVFIAKKHLFCSDWCGMAK